MKMRFVLMFFSAFLFCLISPIINFAKNNNQINLYSSPSTTSKILNTMKASQRFVPIYQQKGWMKVGNPKNGQVGWVNMKQVKKCRKNAEKVYVKSIVVNTSTEKPDGKYTIVGYKNGKKMSQKEAEQVLKQMQRQQMRMQKQMDRMMDNFNFPMPMLD